MKNILDRLDKILEDRKISKGGRSYVASLYEKGNKHMCSKVLEEANELVEATYENKQRMIDESADPTTTVYILRCSDVAGNDKDPEFVSTSVDGDLA